MAQSSIPDHQINKRSRFRFNYCYQQPFSRLKTEEVSVIDQLNNCPLKSPSHPANRRCLLLMMYFNHFFIRVTIKNVLNYKSTTNPQCSNTTIVGDMVQSITTSGTAVSVLASVSVNLTSFTRTYTLPPSPLDILVSSSKYVVRSQNCALSF